MCKAHQLGSAELAGVDHAGMDELIGKDQVVAAGQHRDGAGVGHVARAENEGGRIAFLSGQAIFELLVNGQRPGDQPRGRRADAVSVQCLTGAIHHMPVMRQIQIIVTRKVEDFLSVDGELSTHVGIDPCRTFQPLAFCFIEYRLYPVFTHRRTL